MVSTVSAQQGQPPAVVEIEGILEIRIEDHASGEIIKYSIDTGNRRWDVNVPLGQLKNLTTGSRVRARGRALGQNTLELAGDGGMTTLELAQPNTFGVQRTAVILVNFTDNQSTPHTAADAAGVTFGPVNDFYVENSYGQTSISGDVYGWYTIPMSSAGCDTDTLAVLADQEVTSRGVNLSQYTRKIYSFPANGCTWWGLGTVGGNPSRAWVKGTYNLKVVGHELGHNFGDWHSKSMPCDLNGCSTIEYGDDRDIMGQVGVGHLNAFQKERLGWLNYGSSPAITSVTGPGTYWIDSLQTVGGTKALKILQSSSSGNTYYYVEARTQTGFDAGYSPGVTLHTGNDTDGNTSVQIDLDPQSTAFDSVLDPGQAFVNSAIGLTITTASMEAGGAWVYVQMPVGPPCAYSISPTSSGTLSYAGASSSFSMTAGSGCTWTATSPQSWIHTTSMSAGNGTVSYFIDANTGGSRSGSISVGGQTYTVNQGAAPCSYSLNPTSSGTLSGSGASGSTQMTTSSHCAWTATTNRSWIHPSGAGPGSGTISYTVDPNPGAARSGTITAGGRTYSISQAVQVVACTYSINPTSSGTLTASATSGSFSVTSATGCSWSASTPDSWIHTSSSGTGSGTVTFTVDANTGPARSGSIAVAGQTFSVSQAAGACTYSINPVSSGLLTAAAGGGNFAVTAGSWCGWSATTGDAWIHSSSSGTGNGTVTFTVDANSGALRSGSISVGGQSFTVAQAATDCSYSLSPTSSGSLPASAASGSFGVASAGWCAWSATTGDSWIHTSSSGSGNGTVAYTVDANTGAARNGSIVVAGQTYSVSQAAAPCSYSINPTSSGTLASTANGGNFAITAAAGCSWTATTTFGWIQTSSAGNGNGTVTYTVTANNGSARTGTILVGGKTYTVSQAAGNCKSSALSQTTSQLPASGGGGNATAQAGGGPCKKNLTSNASWITALLIDDESETSTVEYAVEPNTGAARVGTITVDDQTLTIYQDGADDSNRGGKKNGHDSDFTEVIDPATGLPTHWVATATSSRRFIESLGEFDLTGSTISGATFAIETRLLAMLSAARIEVSTDGSKWSTVADVPASAGWIGLDIDLSAYAGLVVHIRAVFDAVAPAAGTAPDSLSIRNPILVRR